MYSTTEQTKQRIHLNSAAASLTLPGVYTAMREYMDQEAVVGSTELMIDSCASLDTLYSDLSKIIDVPKSRIAFFGSNTEAWQKPFLSIDLRPGDRVLVGETEWGGNLSVLKYRCDLYGASLEIIPSTDSGMIDTDALAMMLEDKVRIVCVTWVSAVNGGINPAHRVADILVDSKAWLFVDAAQYFGLVGMDLSHPRFDVVTVSMRKYFRGPRGIAFAALSERFLEQINPLGIDQFSGPLGDDGVAIRNDALKFEYGESSYMIRMGLVNAMQEAQATDWNAVQLLIAERALQLRRGLSAIKGVSVCDTHDALSGIVTFNHTHIPPSEFKAALAAKNINIAAPPSIYAPFWFRTGRSAVSRLSPHAYNTPDEIDLALEAIETSVTSKV